MRRLTCIHLSLFFLAFTAARAAEPPPPTNQPAKPSPVTTEALDEVTEPFIPKRELTFEILQDPASVPTSVEDLKPYKDKYVAEFVMYTPPLTVCLEGRSQTADGAAECAQVQLLHQMFRGHRTPTGDLRNFLKYVPVDRRPTEELVDALGPRIVKGFRKGETNNNYTQVLYYIFAPTSDRAKELVQSFLCLYDYGLSYPVQKECLREKQAAAKRLAQFRENLEKSQAVIADCDKQLEGLSAYKDVSKETLATYCVQQRMLDVDMAGMKARIKACNKILESRKELSTPRAEQVETVKITAEIELVGLEARQSTIAKIVQNGEKYLVLYHKKGNNGVLVEQFRRDIPMWEQKIAGYTAERKAWEMCPIEQRQVIIRPVK